MIASQPSGKQPLDQRMWLKKTHPIAGFIALLTIATFWLSTVIAEISGNHSLILSVKTAIPWGFLLLIPAMAAAGGTGNYLRKGSKARIIDSKRKRMAWLAGNGIFILVPSALFLASKAHSLQFDTSFYIVQGLELAVGATNIALLALNARDGMKLSGRLRRRKNQGVL